MFRIGYIITIDMKDRYARLVIFVGLLIGIQVGLLVVLGSSSPWYWYGIFVSWIVAVFGAYRIGSRGYIFSRWWV